jgi:hypothetical protein
METALCLPDGTMKEFRAEEKYLNDCPSTEMSLLVMLLAAFCVMYHFIILQADFLHRREATLAILLPLLTTIRV